jgi:hypothetical protein
MLLWMELTFFFDNRGGFIGVLEGSEGSLNVEPSCFQVGLFTDSTRSLDVIPRPRFNVHCAYHINFKFKSPPQKG